MFSKGSSVLFKDTKPKGQTLSTNNLWSPCFPFLTHSPHLPPANSTNLNGKAIKSWISP